MFSCVTTGDAAQHLACLQTSSPYFHCVPIRHPHLAYLTHIWHSPCYAPPPDTEQAPLNVIPGVHRSHSQYFSACFTKYQFHTATAILSNRREVGQISKPSPNLTFREVQGSLIWCQAHTGPFSGRRHSPSHPWIRAFSTYNRSR